ncbi:glycosyltransferase family 39 protein [Candidatus Curtissbacteria bacterium]|nr:glycosyltransferase family 39 protein [Candidatus Curtissbacteria bacterium]
MKSFLTKNLLLISILVLAAFLRFFQLGQNPPGLSVDEVSNGYNAYSILKTARDEYGNFLPLTFRSFGDYNLPLSVYTLVPSIAIFGLTEFAVRFPSALFGTLAVLLTYILAKKLFEESQNGWQLWKGPRQRADSVHGQEKLESKIKSSTDGPPKASLAFSRRETIDRTRSKLIALLSAFFLAISPWHLQFSRYDHEANFMVFFIVLGLTTFLYGLKNFSLLAASAVFFGLAVNTYHGAKIWVPLFLIVILFWYRKEIIKFKIKLIWLSLILIVFSLPIILNLQKSLIRGQSVGVLGQPNPLETFITGYLAHYSPNFLFISGDSIGRHSVPGMGQLYVFEAPLVILGILYLIAQKTKSPKFLLAWLVIAAIPAAAATPTPHALRGLTFIPVWSIITACGVTALLEAKFKANLKKGIAFILVVVAFYNIVTYFHLYYKHYPKEKAPDWSQGYKEMVEAVDEIKDNYGSIAITSYFGHPYIFTLFYSRYDPLKYHSQSEDKNKFAKFEFFSSSWEQTKPGKALVITPPWQAHPPKVLKEIYAINGDLKFTISETE